MYMFYIRRSKQSTGVVRRMGACTYLSTIVLYGLLDNRYISNVVTTPEACQDSHLTIQCLIIADRVQPSVCCLALEPIRKYSRDVNGKPQCLLHGKLAKQTSGTW